MKLAVFDLDDVLIHEGFDPSIICDDTIVVLEYLKKNNILMAIASYNNEAKNILESLGLANYFDQIIAYEDNTCKVSQLKILCSIYDNIDIQDIVFFDDLNENINKVEKLGIKSVLVNHIIGITLNDIKKVIKN